MSLREQQDTRTIKSKYVKAPNGRIFLNNPNLAKLTDMTAIDVQGFEDPAPETVDQLNEMIAAALKAPKKETPDPVDNEITDDTFDFSRANKKQIAKKAKENFDIDLDVEGKDVADVRKEYEFLLATGGSNDDSGTGSD